MIQENVNTKESLHDIKAEETDDAMKFSDSKTFYLLENDEVVLP